MIRSEDSFVKQQSIKPTSFPTAVLSRRDFVKLAAVVAGASLPFTGGVVMAASVIRKAIPKTGELLPVIGLGTWQTFDVGASKAAREPLKKVLREFVGAGGKLIVRPDPIPVEA